MRISRFPNHEIETAIAKSVQTTEELQEELADARLLHRLSIELIQEDGTLGLYKKIVEAAVTIMRSQYASMQALFPDEGGALRFLAGSGFSPEAESFWKWVYPHTGSSCGAALVARKRVIIPNYATCDFMQGAPTLPVFLNAGILAAQSTPLYSRNGKLLGMISTHWTNPHTPSERHLYLLDVLARQAADLIERTQTEEALKASEDRLRTLATQLEERVNERTKELQRSNADLQQFAHVASHDLKEPVRKIKTYSLRLEEELNGHASENAKLYTKKVLESAGRMSTMIEGVLTYSSLNAHEQKTELVDLNRMLADIKNDLEVSIDQSCAVIRSQVFPNIEGSQVLLYQLFYNIINNSLKFAKKDQAPFISITCELMSSDNSDFAKIVIADNGIGFEPEYNQEIFTAFTRLHSKTSYDGTGLGLSLAKKIVERHHGTIEADGMSNEGAIFTVTLPLKQPVPQQ